MLLTSAIASFHAKDGSSVWKDKSFDELSVLVWKRNFITHANSPGLSGSLPDTERISRSPVRVTKPPG